MGNIQLSRRKLCILGLGALGVAASLADVAFRPKPAQPNSKDPTQDKQNFDDLVNALSNKWSIIKQEFHGGQTVVFVFDNVSYRTAKNGPEGAFESLQLELPKGQAAYFAPTLESGFKEYAGAVQALFEGTWKDPGGTDVPMLRPFMSPFSDKPFSKPISGIALIKDVNAATTKYACDLVFEILNTYIDILEAGAGITVTKGGLPSTEFILLHNCLSYLSHVSNGSVPRIAIKDLPTAPSHSLPERVIDGRTKQLINDIFNKLTVWNGVTNVPTYNRTVFSLGTLAPSSRVFLTAISPAHVAANAFVEQNSPRDELSYCCQKQKMSFIIITSPPKNEPDINIPTRSRPYDRQVA